MLFLGILLMIVGLQFFSIGLIGEMIISVQNDDDTYVLKRSIGIKKSDQDN